MTTTATRPAATQRRVESSCRRGPRQAIRAPRREHASAPSECSRARRRATKATSAQVGSGVSAATTGVGVWVVCLADGNTKRIDQIEVGDEVIATDPETGEVGPRTVTATWPHDDWLLDLELEDGSEIRTTEDHRYWNETDQAWQESQDLDPGDLLLTSDGGTIAVDGLDWTTVEWGPAYDLTVDDLHTYYVSSDSGDEVLAHNCSPGTSDVWKDFNDWRGKTRTNGLSGKNKRYYEWDYTHNDIEVYDKAGRHLGSMDPNTGEMIKPAVSGRTIDVS